MLDKLFSSSEKEPNVSKNTRNLLWALTATLLAFIAWGFIGRLDVVSVAMGEVIPVGQVKQVQHLEGGIVSKILVREGERVEKDQPLIELEATKSNADLNEVKHRVTALRIDIARLQAEADGLTEPKFPDDLIASHPNQIAEAMDLMSSRLNRFNADKQAVIESVKQRQQDIKSIKGRLYNDRKSLKLLQEQVKISEDLLKDELTNRYTHLGLLRELSDIKARVAENDAGLARSQSALEEAKAQERLVQASFTEESQKQLEDAQREYAELSERLKTFTDNLNRTVLRAPVSGIVKQLYTVTEGGVVRPGGAVVDLVPAKDRLIVEAKLLPQDVGHVELDDTAVVKLTSSDASLFGQLEGRVIHISPDTYLEEDGQPYYKVRVQVEQDHFANGSERYQLLPGVQVMVDIITGSRSVMAYLFAPYMHGMSEAMRER